MNPSQGLIDIINLDKLGEANSFIDEKVKTTFICAIFHECACRTKYGQMKRFKQLIKDNTCPESYNLIIKLFKKEAQEHRKWAKLLRKIAS